MISFWHLIYFINSATINRSQDRFPFFKRVAARRLAKVLFGLAVAAFLSAAADAQETEASGSIVKIYIKTNSASLQISKGLVQAVTPTKVNCPSKCNLVIRFDTQVSGLTPGDPNVVGVVVHVDGSVSQIAPNAVLGFDSTSTGGGSNTRSFTWLASKLEAGSHIVDVLLFVPEGSAGSANRTVSIYVVAHHSESD